VTLSSNDDPYNALRQVLGLLFASNRRRQARQRRAGRINDAHLGALSMLTEQAEATAGTLARRAYLNPASGTPMVDQLVRRGLLERRQDSQDRRQSLISLTTAGRLEVAEQDALYRRRFKETFAGITPDELSTAIKVIERIIAVMDSIDEEMTDSGEEDIEALPVAEEPLPSEPCRP